jgi:hypothetical protein
MREGRADLKLKESIQGDKDKEKRKQLYPKKDVTTSPALSCRISVFKKVCHYQKSINLEKKKKEIAFYLFLLILLTATTANNPASAIIPISVSS